MNNADASFGHKNRKSGRRNDGAHYCGQGQLEFSRPHRDVSSVLSRWDKYEQENPKQSQNYVAPLRRHSVVVQRAGLSRQRSRVRLPLAAPYPCSSTDRVPGYELGDSISSRGTTRCLMRDSSVWSERLAHNQEVVGSEPTPATIRQASSSVGLEHRPDKPGVESSSLSLPTIYGDSSMVERCVYTADVGDSSSSPRTTATGLWAGHQPSKLDKRVQVPRGGPIEERTHSSRVEHPAHNGGVGSSILSGSTRLLAADLHLGLLSLMAQSDSEQEHQPLAADLQAGLLNPLFSVRLRAGAPSLMVYSKLSTRSWQMYAGNSMAEYRPFKARVQGSSPCRRTSRLLKRGLLTQLAEYPVLTRDVRDSISREPTSRPVAPIGRAAVSKTACWGFESLLACHAPIAQLGRALGCQSRGCGFDFRLALQAPIAQSVEHFLGKEEVGSSILPWSSNASVVQLVEHLIRIQEVGSSILSRSSGRHSSMVEHLTCNQGVVDSSSTVGSKSWGCRSTVDRELCKLGMRVRFPPSPPQFDGV